MTPRYPTGRKSTKLRRFLMFDIMPSLRTVEQWMHQIATVEKRGTCTSNLKEKLKRGVEKYNSTQKEK